jgi:endoglucanase
MLWNLLSPKSTSRPRKRSLLPSAVSLALGASTAACIRPPVEGGVSPSSGSSSPAPVAASVAPEPMTELDAWDAVPRMTPGINIGNTLESTNTWETGWGNPRITKDYVESLAHLGFKSVRVPVAWDTFAVDEHIAQDKLRRVGEVVDWIIGAGMFCVVNIHWDNGWIDSGSKERFPDTYATFSPVAERKYRVYWTQISSFLAAKNEKLIFEALNEETKFDNAGSVPKAYATLTHVNQLFIDTVRHTGGNNPKRLLIVTGYATDITKTASSDYALPQDTVPHRLFISVHYYTPWPFCGMTEDASWGKMATTWGSAEDVAELERLFDVMGGFCTRNDIPAFIGEFGVTERKESASRVRWMSAVIGAAVARKMVPVLWDTGSGVSRLPPYQANDDLSHVLKNAAALQHAPSSG